MLDVGISKTQSMEVLEQHDPVLFERYALSERSGDTVTVCTLGGGGYGDPWQRDPVLVAREQADAPRSAPRRSRPAHRPR